MRMQQNMDRIYVSMCQVAMKNLSKGAFQVFYGLPENGSVVVW